ncbi:hypothetical protein LDENG_00090730 [Lucifuga dentata]|nr:hypothetical protein LDENG_00090730 [Lucifuga dentata]
MTRLRLALAQYSRKSWLTPWSLPALNTTTPSCLESPTNFFTDFHSFRTLLPGSLHKPSTARLILIIQLLWLPVPYQTDFKLFSLHSKLFITWLLPISQTPKTYTPSHSLPSSSAGLLSVRDFSLTTMGGRAFSHTAPRLWNSLSFSTSIN